MKKQSPLEETFAWQCKVAGLPPPERQFRFDPKRRWRADFAWPDPHRLIVELEGGIFARRMKNGQPYGWHQSVQRMLGDLEKYNRATLLGYRVLRYSAKEIKSGRALSEVEGVLNGNGRDSA